MGVSAAITAKLKSLEESLEPFGSLDKEVMSCSEGSFTSTIICRLNSALM